MGRLMPVCRRQPWLTFYQSFQFQGFSFHGVNVCSRHCAIPFDR
jgi:hypothetical protein